MGPFVPCSVAVSASVVFPENPELYNQAEYSPRFRGGFSFSLKNNKNLSCYTDSHKMASDFQLVSVS